MGNPQVGIPRISARSRSKATRVVEIKTSWKGRANSFGGSRKRDTSDKRQAKRQECPPELNALHQVLKQYKVIKPIKEMAEQSPCCIMFLQELLKKHVDLSEEELISLTSECHHTYEVLAEVRFDGEGCFTLPIEINGDDIEQGLYDSGANANLMSLTKARELGIKKISSYPYTIGYANGHEEEALSVLKNFPLNIRDFDYYLDIVIADTRVIYEFSLILEYDASQIFEWRLVKGVVDDYARRKIEEEEARGYPSDEDYDFEEDDEIKEPEGHELPSTS
ncbi:hypothetical protein MTR_5g058690 [Medicago truncatula]|uniref:Aspartic peptidase domain-containing protein n=1 Tax=Medicago truncatula TaxID=3880 RepID=G7K8U0_MEDTR|nr:hypothetical protein MTR_5g058690 [Medicago truncatula]